MSSFILKVMLTSLICTIVIELVVALLLKVNNKLDLLNIFLVNLLTNPLLVSTSLFINIYYGLSLRKILIIPMEIIVVLIEGLIYKKYLTYKKVNPIILSLILNASSYIMGILINYLLY